jgi:hypothetical protein
MPSSTCTRRSRSLRCALEVGEPVELVADYLGDAVQLDDLGMRTVPAAAAREFLAGRAEQAARIADQARRQTVGPAPVAVGVPAQSGSTPLESLMAAESHYETPAEEFGRIPKPNFLVEELEAGARQQAAAQAAALAEIEARKGKDR